MLSLTFQSENRIIMFRIKKRSIIIGLTLAILGLAGETQAQGVTSNTMKCGRLLRLIDSYYVDTTNVESLTEKAIVNVLGELDPHSVYISKDEVEKMNEPLKGSFEGIGISFNIFKDTLMVLTIIPGGPSEKVGLRPGDRIVEVDGKEIAGIGIKNSDVFDMLRGDKGTKVNLKIKRKKNKDLLDFVIIRGKIPINSLDASYMINEETGYIKLNRFSATTTDEFMMAINELKANDFENLILDLRGNGGGYLKAAIDLDDQFLGAYKMVVYTEGINNKRREYRSTASGEFEEGKLVVLIDEGSASASEIVSGAVQDWDRGIVIGRRSFGKGLVQQPFMLSDGSMIRLTTAHYHTPSGRCIQKPYENGVDEYRKEYLTRFETGEFFSEDSVHLDESQVYETITNKRKVFGGGGIMPDIFVPMDTSSHYKYYNQLVRRNIVYTAVLDYLDKDRDKLKQKYPDFSAYREQFDLPGSFFEKIIAEGEKEEIEKDDESIEFAKPIMKRQVRALIARDLYGQSYYYQIVNEDSDAIKEALYVLTDQLVYDKLLVEK